MIQEKYQKTYNHVLFVYPYKTGLKYWKVIPPIGLEIIASAAEQYCQSMDVVDMRYEKNPLEHFITDKTDAVCFSINWDLDTEYIQELIQSVPSGVQVIVGGRHATDDPEKWLTGSNNIDLLVRGDGEDIIQQIFSGENINDIPGVSYVVNGELVHNPMGESKQMENWYYPNRKHRRYQYQLMQKDMPTGIQFDMIRGSRGCPYTCKFCSFSKNPFGKKIKWVPRPVEEIVQELKETDATLVAFVDDIFTFNMERVEQLCDRIIEEGIKKSYMIHARLELAKHPRIMKKMEKAGFSVLLIGVESVHDKTLDSMSKGFTREEIQDYFKVLSKSRMILNAYFIIGNMGESREEIEEIGTFSRKIGVDTLSLSYLRTMPFDGLGEIVENYPGYSIDDEGFVISNVLSRNDLKKIRHSIQRKFYSPKHVTKLVYKAYANRILTPRSTVRIVKNIIRQKVSN